MSEYANIRLLAFDIDGVFTDGRFYLSDDGVETKAFSTQDGFGIRRAIDAGLEVAVISGRSSKAVTLRMQELGVQHVFLACKDKVSTLEDLAASLDIAVADCAFVGDDVPDLALLNRVGLPIAVANAVAEVRNACSVTTRARGGHGAVREVCDLIVAAKG